MRMLSLALVLSALWAPVALGWPGRPSASAPTPPALGAPPPAWIETPTRSAWLAYGSYCWTRSGHAACVDMLPPQTRPDLPRIRAARAATLRIHLAIRNPVVTLSSGGKPVRVDLDRSRGIVSWSPKTSGVIELAVRAAGGSASYVARLRIG